MIFDHLERTHMLIITLYYSTYKEKRFSSCIELPSVHISDGDTTDQIKDVGFFFKAELFCLTDCLMTPFV